MQGPKIDPIPSALPLSPLTSSSSSTATHSASGVAPLERTRSLESFERAKSSAIGVASGSAPLDTEKDRAELHSSLSSSSSADILRNSQKFPFMGDVLPEIAPDVAESVSSSSSSSSSSSISPALSPDSSSSSESVASSSSSSSSGAVSGRVVPLAVSLQRMEQAQALRNQLNDLDNWKPSPGMKPAQVAALRSEMAGIKANMQAQLDSLKQEILSEIITPEIRSMPNSPEKAQAIFSNFMERGRGLYHYHPTGTPRNTDLMMGDLNGACGNFAKAFATCLKEAGFADVKGAHLLDLPMNRDGRVYKDMKSFVTKPIDGDFIDARATGNIDGRDGGRAYVFTNHIVVNAGPMGFFCPTTGKFGATEEDLGKAVAEAVLHRVSDGKFENKELGISITGKYYAEHKESRYSWSS